QGKLLEAQRAIANVASAPLSENMLNQDAKQFQRKINRDAGEIEVLHGLIRNQGGVVSMPGTGVSSGARAAIAASIAPLGRADTAARAASSAATRSQSVTGSASGRE